MQNLIENGFNVSRSIYDLKMIKSLFPRALLPLNVMLGVLLLLEVVFLPDIFLTYLYFVYLFLQFSHFLTRCTTEGVQPSYSRNLM